MTPSLPGSRIGEIFHNEIEPNLEAKVERARDEQRFVLVFVGGQPGAGKSRVVGLAAVEHRGAVIIDGDDLLKYHPDYDRLMREDPLRMPDVTAEASGQWVGMTAEYLRLRGAAAVLETTMRQPEVVASTARQFRESGYAIEARCLAVPPAGSRLGTLSRYVGQVQEFGAGRWTASQAHDAATTGMPLTVEALVDRGLVDQAIVQRRDGQVVFDRAFDPEAVMRGDGAAVKEQIEFGRSISSMTEAEARDWVDKLTEINEYLGQAPHIVNNDVRDTSVRLMRDAREVAATGWPQNVARRNEALRGVAEASQWLAPGNHPGLAGAEVEPVWTQPPAGPGEDSGPSW